MAPACVVDDALSIIHHAHIDKGNCHRLRSQHCVCTQQLVSDCSRTCIDGGVQLLQARVDLVVHLPPPALILREGIAIGAVRLTDLQM